MKENSLVKQHNKLIEARYKLSITEQRLIRMLISMIERDDEDFKQYAVRVVDLATILNIKGGDIYPAIERAVNKLMDTPIKFNDGDDLVNVRWLSSSRYQSKKGIALLRFDPELKPFLLQLKSHITYYQLGNIIHLKHTASIRIYELLKQYENIGNRKFSVEQIRNILMIGENEYKQYRDFRRWILKVAQTELKEKTDITFEYIEEKQGRNVNFINFIITKQKRIQSVEGKEQLLFFDGVQPIEIKDEHLLKPPLNKQVEHLATMGVTRSTAEQIAAKYDIDRIERGIAYTQSKQQEGAVKNPAAFVVTAIKQDFTDALAEEKRKKAQAQQERKKLAQEKQAAADKESEEVRDRYKKAFTAFQALSEAEQAGLKDEFIRSANSTIADLIRKAKNQDKDILASTIIAPSFKLFLIERKGF